MSMTRFESIVKHTIDTYEFNLTDLAVSINDVFFISDNDDDKGDFKLMMSRLTNHNRNEFKRLLAYIINEFYQNEENIQCNYGCSVIESDHQTMELQVRSDNFGVYFGKYVLIVTVESETTESQGLA